MEQRKEIAALESRVRWVRLIALSLCVVWVLCSILLGGSVFAYEVEETKIVEEPYEYVTGTVSTYVCFTTTYGEKYHARSCGSLWNSSHETTVYQAEQEGYSPCSLCTPYEETTLVLTETRYREVEWTETVTKEPKLLVWVIGTSAIILVYKIVYVIVKRKGDMA